MSSVTNATVPVCGADIHPLISIVYPCAWVFVCVICVHGPDKMGAGLLSRFVKANMIMSLSVCLRAVCVRPMSSHV